MRFVVIFFILVSILFAARRAHACGAAYPGGPMVCTLEDAPSHKAAERPVMPIARVSASWSYTSTTILFGEGRRGELTRHAVFAGTELPLGRGVGLRFGAGGIVAGELTPNLASVSGQRTAASFGPGATAFLGVAKTIINETSQAPFVQLSATMSASRVATRGPAPNEAPSFTAFDVRAAGTIGKTLGRVLVPYVALRVFGGPIFYEYSGQSVTGTDLYKYQVGGGLAFALPSRVLDAFVEGVPLGESGMSAGLGTSF